MQNLLLLLFSLSGPACFAQLDLTKLQPVDQHVIRCFVNARCATYGDSAFTVEKFPSFFRTQFISKFYDLKEVIPFRIYYAEDIGKPGFTSSAFSMPPNLPSSKSMPVSPPSMSKCTELVRYTSEFVIQSLKSFSHCCTMTQ
jgi:hypothetical protein